MTDEWKDIYAKCNDGEIEPCHREYYGEHPTTEKSSAVGNAAALRDALGELVANIEMRSTTFGLNVMVDTKTFLDAKSALSAPPRNCDVLTAKEQSIRFDEFCQECGKCPLNEKRLNTRLVQCEFLWAQMPYEKGDNDGK